MGSPVPEVLVSEESSGDLSSPKYTYYGTGLVPIADEEEPLRNLLTTYEIDGVDDSYLTTQLLRHILTPERVQRELEKKKYGISVADIQLYLDKIHPPASNHPQTSYLKIFTVLILIGKVQSFGDFIRDKISDEYMPFEIRKYISGRPICGKREPGKHLQCFRYWNEHEKDSLVNMYQWMVIVEYFDLTNQKGCKEYELYSKSRRPWRNSTHDGKHHKRLEQTGGYGSVVCVEIHPTSHGFSEALEEIKLNNGKFAIKTLHEASFNDEAKFRQELNQLRRFSGFVHPHLVTTLGAFKHNGKWSFIFPSAYCNLEEYILEARPNPSWGFPMVSWTVKQLCGIMGALNTIHNPKHLHVGVKKYGRHGDIKCDNILCFRLERKISDQQNDLSQDLLVISDFGLSAFNSENSRSNIPNKTVPAVPGYRPPECDIEGGTISRAFDIWTVGCLFLETVSWLLGGKSYVDLFAEKRTTTYINGSKNDIFFRLKAVDGQDTHVAQVKPEVTEWIDSLRGHQNCSQLLHDILSIIEDEMLVVLETDYRRSPSQDILRKLETARSRCASDTTYAVEGRPKTVGPHRRAPAVEAQLNQTARDMLKSSNIPLPVHKGETRKSMQPAEFQEVERMEDGGK